MLGSNKANGHHTLGIRHYLRDLRAQNLHEIFLTCLKSITQSLQTQERVFEDIHLALDSGKKTTHLLL